MIGNPVDWWHYTWWSPVVVFVGWTVLYRFKPSIKGDFAIGGVILSIILFLSLGGYSDYWTTERDKAVEKEENIQNIREQFDRITAHYPDLKNFTYSYDGEKVVSVQFSEPDGDRCEGDVDGNDILDVTCQEIYDPPDEGEGG